MKTKSKNEYRLPKVEHEHSLTGILGVPNSINVLNDAGNAIQDMLVEHYSWPKNHMIHGMVYQILWNVYKEGEKRGIARENNPASALFPVAAGDDQ